MSGADTVFNTTSVEVAAAPEAAWDTFLDRSRWMETFGRRTLVSGVDGTAGAVAEVTMAVAGSAVRREETLFCAAARRLVVRITAEGSAMAAHADFQFDPVVDGCRIQVSIHSWMPGTATDERARMHALTQAKIDADFARLRDVLRVGG